MQQIQSVCTYCGTGCDIVADVKDSEILKIHADPEGKVSRGKLCVKGKEGYEYLYSPNRLRKPYIRRAFIAENMGHFPESIAKKLFLLKGVDENWLTCSYEMAYDIAAWKLNDVKRSYGRKAFAAVGGARTNCESSFTLQKFTREVIESPHVDNCGRVCHAPSLKGMRMSIGEGAASNPFDDIYDAQCMVVIGSNTTEAHPIVANRIMERVNQGIPLFIIDVRTIKLAKFAQESLVIPYESNLLTLNMIAYVILSEGLYDEAFMSERTVGFESYKTSILNDPYANPEFYSGLKGYETLPEQIRTLARTYAKNTSLIMWGLGITEHLDGSKAVSAVCNLALLTGNVGKAGAGLMPLRGQNNVQGTCDMGMMPYYDPDYAVPKEEGLVTPDMVDAMIDGEIKALWNMSEDLGHIHTNQNKVHEALASLECCIVNDLFMNETTEHADIVFGVKSAYEKEGVYVNAERRLHLAQPLIPSNMPDDWEVIQEVARRMGTDFGFDTTEDAWNAVRKKAPTRFGGAAYAKLKEKRRDGLQWPIQEHDTPRLHETSFRTKDGLGRLIYHTYDLRGQVEELLSNQTAEFYLTTGRIITHYNNSRQTAECEKLYNRHPEDILHISIEDGDRFDPEKRYFLKTQYGQTRPFRIKISKEIKSGTLYTSMHHAKMHINYIFGDEADSYVKTARFKSVKVEVIEAE